eukprot:s925_g1.t1
MGDNALSPFTLHSAIALAHSARFCCWMACYAFDSETAAAFESCAGCWTLKVGTIAVNAEGFTVARSFRDRHGHSKYGKICMCKNISMRAASMRGLDLSSFCDFGHFQKDAGLLACTSLVNAVFVPLHFYGAVGSLRLIESLAARAWQELAEDDLGNEMTETEMTEEVFTKNLISLATALAAAFDLAVTFYLIWRLTGPGPLAHPWMSLTPATPLEPAEQKASGISYRFISAMTDGLEEVVPQTYELVRIGTFQSCFPTAFGCPRQGLAAPSVRGRIQLAPWMQTGGSNFLAGLEAFSHVWVMFLFDKNKHSSTSFSSSSFLKPTVRPPWLAGDDGRRGTRGVFATRSPHRPNPLGLTLCRLDYVDQAGATLYVSGVDVVSGSAVLDIKPYHPVDSLGGKLVDEDLRFAEWLPEPRASAEVTWSASALDELQHLQSLCQFYPDMRDARDLEDIPNASRMTALQLLRSSVDQVIGLDPRPPQSRSDRSDRSTEKTGKSSYGYWAMDFDGLSVVFRSSSERQGSERGASTFEVVRVQKCEGAKPSKGWLQELEAELEGNQAKEAGAATPTKSIENERRPAVASQSKSHSIVAQSWKLKVLFASVCQLSFKGMRRTVMRFAQKSSQRHGERLDSSSGFPDAAQWALTVGLGTLIPGFALFKLFTVTGAVEAERGAQEELARHQRQQEAAHHAVQPGRHEVKSSVTV